MDFEAAQRLLSGTAPEKVKDVLEKSLAAGEPKTREVTVNDEGRYNGVGLPLPAAEILTVNDGAETPPAVRLLGEQQVVADRPFIPPVVVEYVSLNDAIKHRQKLIKEMHKRNK